MDRGSMGFHLGQVSSQLQMGGRQLPCRSKVQEKARIIVSWSGVSEITWVENSTPFEGRRGIGWALPRSAG